MVVGEGCEEKTGEQQTGEVCEAQTDGAEGLMVQGLAILLKKKKKTGAASRVMTLGQSQQTGN